LLVLVTSSHPVVRRETNELEAGSTFIVLALDAAPAVLLAVIASGVIHAFVPDAMIARIGRGPSIVQALRGASVTAAIALLVGAPELGAPALMVSWALLGRSMTIARAASALFIAIAVSLVVGRLAKSQPAAPPPHADVATDRISAFRVGVTDVLEHTGPWLIAGLVVAALVEPMLRADMFAQLPAMAQVPILAVVSMPFYVCASGATPLVAVLMHKGMAPGAALAFLVAGPASNLTTFGVLARLHGRKVAVVYVATITALAVVVGIIANVVVTPIEHAALHDVERRPASHFDIACLVMVTGLFVALLLRRGPRHLLGQIVSRDHHAEHGELT
ncbi:MAG TPA: permease, partial [Polyangiaceae bacterium]|nr:permease [Polyangiaceae bacterium]